jgi:phosphatidylglycerophosphate synthase
MLDAFVRRFSDVVFNAAGRFLASIGLTADALTFLGLGFGLLIVPAVIYEHFPLAFGLFVMNRLCDGLDGAVARATNRLTLYGGLLDFVFDSTHVAKMCWPILMPVAELNYFLQ